MISFRFHVVSITAVFLAIAIGVVVGSTFVDRAIVDGLQERIDNVSANLDDRRAEIADLRDDIGRLDEFATATEAFAVSGRLTDQAVLVVAPRGVDEDAVRSTVALAAVAGATAPGVVWIEPRWALGDDGAVDELAELVEVDAVGAGEPDELRAAAWSAALEELIAPAAGEVDPETAPAGEEPPLDPTSTTTTTTTTGAVTEEPPDVEVLTALLEGGYLSFEPAADGATLESVAERSPAVVSVTGNTVDEELVGMVPPLVAGLLDAGLPTVVAEVYDEPGDDEADAPRRGDAATAAVPEGASTEVAVVDHLDLGMGRVAAVLAAADLRRGVVGRYGFGERAAAVVPAWTPL